MLRWSIPSRATTSPYPEVGSTIFQHRLTTLVISQKSPSDAESWRRWNVHRPRLLTASSYTIFCGTIVPHCQQHFSFCNSSHVMKRFGDVKMIDVPVVQMNAYIQYFRQHLPASSKPSFFSNISHCVKCAREVGIVKALAVLANSSIRVFMV